MMSNCDKRPVGAGIEIDLRCRDSTEPCPRRPIATPNLQVLAFSFDHAPKGTLSKSCKILTTDWNSPRTDSPSNTATGSLKSPTIPSFLLLKATAPAATSGKHH